MEYMAPSRVIETDDGKKYYAWSNPESDVKKHFKADCILIKMSEHDSIESVRQKVRMAIKDKDHE